LVWDLVLGVGLSTGEDILFCLLGIDISLAIGDETKMSVANGSEKETAFGDFLCGSS
jgi:hypothetical protein